MSNKANGANGANGANEVNQAFGADDLSMSEPSTNNEFHKSASASPSENELQSFENPVLEGIYGFLVAYFHQSSYLARVYPSEAYKLTRFHSAAVYECQHPGVKHWIEQAASKCMEILEQNRCTSTLALLILESNRVVRRFGFNVQMVVRDGEDNDGESQINKNKNKNKNENVNQNADEARFEGCLNQLLSLFTNEPEFSINAQNKTGKMRPNRTMTVVCESEPASQGWHATNYEEAKPPIEAFDSFIVPFSQEETAENSVLALNLFVSN